MSSILIWGLTGSFGGVERYITDRLPLFQAQYDEIYFGFGAGIGSDIEWAAFLKKDHIHICYFPHLSNPRLYYTEIVQFLKAKQINTVYCNLGFANGILYKAIKEGGAKLVVHAHNTRIDVNNTEKRVALNFYHYISRVLFDNLIDEKYACSTEAGKWVFSKDNFQIKKNAIDLTAYRYNPSVRDEVRHDLHIAPDTFVIGHVGRFSYQKNHEFLLRLFSKFVKKHSNSLLMLIGTGEKFAEMQSLAHSLEIESQVLFLGLRKDVNRLMQAMDCFVLPSRFEGLPIVGIEAQAAALPCFFSDAISRELLITNEAIHFSLNEDIGELAELIYQSMHSYVRHDNADIIAQSGYDLNKELKELD